MLSNNDIGLPVIRANNINEGYLNMETDIKYWYEKDPQGADINNYLVSKGDILINFINSEAKMGTATVVQKVLNRKTIYTTNILKARVDENYDKYFWFTLTLTDKYKNDIKIITKPAVNQASFTTVDFKKLSYLFPNLKEQQKIGNYFSNLDRLITLHQRKILLYKYFFTIVWEQRKVHEIADRYDNLRVPVAAKFRTPGTTPYYGANGIQDFVEGYTHEGEFVLVAEDGANDLKNYPVKCVNGRIWVNNHAHVLQAKTQIADNKFLAYCISQAKIETFLVGGGRAKLNAEVMMDIVLYVPNLQEQKAIGHYLMQIDCLITLHRCKCIIYRKNMVNAWEQRKLSEFVDKAVDNRGKTPPLDENGTHPLIEVAALGGVHPDYSKIEKYLNDISFENSLRAYIKEGDILFTTVGSIGLVSLMDSREEAAIAQNIVAFRAKENFVPEYLYALFSNGENQYKATRIVMGAVQPSIKVSQLVDVEYMLTSNVKEQKKIGAYFSNLDHLITLHQWKCIVCTKIKVNTWIQCKFIKIGVKLQKCILLSIILLFKRRKVSCVFYVNILLRFIKVIELEVELVFVIIDGTIIVMFYLKIRCLYLNIFIFKINK